MQLTPIMPTLIDLTPAERDYARGQLARATARAREALALLEAPRQLAPPDGARRMRDAATRLCRDAAEHLYDVLQVDVPTEMVADVRHAIEQLDIVVTRIDDPRRQLAPIQRTTAPLNRTIRLLDRIEHELTR